MKLLFLCGLISILMLLSACSSIPVDERKAFCESKGLEYYSQNEDQFSCGITDTQYLIQKAVNEQENKEEELKIKIQEYELLLIENQRQIDLLRRELSDFYEKKTYYDNLTGKAIQIEYNHLMWEDVSVEGMTEK